jgi:hypothetical protein
MPAVTALTHPLALLLGLGLATLASSTGPTYEASRT